jgi:acyl-CoA synthetase (AMP-forming)/AMP-acid ligase II
MYGYSPGSTARSALRDDGWLLTGDLGYLADGELFVVGRKDDLIIRAGQNYYPHDLEAVASRVPGVRLGRAVAFAAPDAKREHIVVAVERDERWDGTIQELRAAVAQAVFSAVRFRPDAIIVLPARSIPLTTSGKLIRPEARRLYQDTWRADA